MIIIGYDNTVVLIVVVVIVFIAGIWIA